MSKRIHVTIPDYVYEGLERRADKQGRPIASLASFVLEVALLEAQKRGELPPDPEKPK
ncbi:ribbon-helix-helix domain-containing protein [Lusitaniella coriacea]|uniref:ribbon-helix-helix domain-containing protein n=1 Tax=Lusitaniella coriacea TaxID=1983105 RepID=UPI003CF88CBF